MEHYLKSIGAVEVKGCDLHYRCYEPEDQAHAARTPLVVLHGGPGACHELWYEALQDLSNDRPTLFYDQRGSYHSPAKIEASTMTLDQFVEDLHAVVTDAGLKKFALLGHSFGGALALAYMQKHSDSVCSLVLSSPLISAAQWKADSMKLLTALGYNAQEILALEDGGQTQGGLYKKAVEAFEAAHARRTKNGEALCKEIGKTFNSKVYTHMWGHYEFQSTGVLKALDLTPTLSNLKTPTLFLCGEYDSVTAETMHEAAALVEASQVCVVEKAGHLSFLDNQDAYIKAVRAHLDVLDPA